MAQIGYVALLFALPVSIYCVVAMVIGTRSGNGRLVESAKGGILSVAFLTTVASGALLTLLVKSDFTVEYVARYTSRALPLIYKISAFWAGNEGSLLLWVWVLVVMAAVLVWTDPKEGRELKPYVLVIMMLVGIFFFYILNFVSRPFDVLPVPPRDGNGLNPLLQNPGMVIHPTTLYVGYVGFAVPFAYAMAALILRKTGDTWIRITRRWTLFAWLFLSIGMIYGAQWAYVELGWGGYWAWDPVENASLLPWLTGTAFLHSVMIQERKGMMKVWNVMLIIITFLLTIFGTFLTRSGVLASVHAFGDNTLGYYFLGFLGIALAGSLYLAVDRLPYLQEENRFESLLSKESSFLLNNLLLVGAAFAVFWGTTYPLISEAVTGQKVSVQAPFFNTVFVPIGLVLILLIAICPLIAWRKASLENLVRNFLYPLLATVAFAIVLLLMGIRHWGGLLSYSVGFFVAATILLEFYRGVKVRQKLTGEGLMTALYRLVVRNRRRYGGYLVHLAIILMLVGITGSSVFKQEVIKTVLPGESLKVAGYEMKFNRLEAEFRPEKGVIYADLEVSRDGRQLGILRTAKEAHPNADSLITEVGIMGSLKEDLFVILAGFSQRDYEALFTGGKAQDPVTFKVYINPLIAWIWLGEYLLVVGTVFAVWPGRRIKPKEAGR